MTKCLICRAEVGRSAIYCKSCGTVQPQRRVGGTIALAILVGALILAALAAILF